MTEGEWKLTLAAVEPGNTATFPVALAPDGSTEPQWWETDYGLVFQYKNGHRVVWPWANILNASYTPPAGSLA